MDKLLSAGRDLLESQGQGQGQVPHDRRDDDAGLHKADQEASRLAGSSGSTDLFSRVVGALGQRKSQIADEDVDEYDLARKHEQTYQNDAHGDESSLGGAAALQAFMKFTQGDGGDKDKESQGGGQSTFLAIAMSEASKLFDDKAAKGKVPEGASKESTVQKAGEMAMKMYFKNQAKKQGGLAGMASQFIK